MGKTYAGAGVDTEAGQEAVRLIKKKAESTFHFYPGEVVTGIGGFSGIVTLPGGMVAGFGADGVGTKLMIAIIMGQHDTVGIDLVAMCVNDLAVAGISPALFLDYIAMGVQIPERTDQIVSGIVSGCNMASTALIGGEMAEMPGLYGRDDYDLAGFAVGFAKSKADLILGQDVRIGMKVFGLPSSGIHANGYTLVRDVTGINVEDRPKTLEVLGVTVPGTNRTLGEELMEPTIIYVEYIKRMLSEYDVAGMIHVTGGGWFENPPRVLPQGCAVRFKKNSWPVLPIFSFIQKKGAVAGREMLKTFNMGIGLMVVSAENIKDAFYIGDIIKGNQEVFFE